MIWNILQLCGLKIWLILIDKMMSAIFLILTCILFIIMLVIAYRSEDDFCRPIKYKKMVEEERKEKFGTKYYD